MLDYFNPWTALKHSLERSRLLRVTFIAAVINGLIAIVIVILGRVHPGVAALLLFLNAATWYFAVSTAAGFRTFQRLSGGRSWERTVFVVDAVCRAVIVFVQMLFFVMIVRLWNG